MNGSPTPLTKEVNEILIAIQNPPEGGDFVWDGQDEDDRPLSREEMLAGMSEVNCAE
jgi:hypothetical protein